MGCRIVGMALALVILLSPNHLGAANASDAKSPAGWIATMTATPEQAKTIAASNGVDWCQTQIIYDRKYPQKSLALQACPTEGDCDAPGNRDAAIPDSGQSKLTIRLKFNVFRNDGGGSAAASQADVDAQVVQLNSDFDPSRVQFVYTTEFINSTQFRQFLDSEESFIRMYEDILTFLQSWIPEYVSVSRSYLTVALGCTGGQHRSVRMTEKLAAALNESHEPVHTRHNELPINSVNTP